MSNEKKPAPAQPATPADHSAALLDMLRKHAPKPGTATPAPAGNQRNQ